MIQSMTGFASKNVFLDLDAENKIKLSINIKSLNSKYFDINCKLPYVLSQFETDFLKLIKSKLHRGYIYLNIHISDTNVFKTTARPAFNTVSNYIDALKQIQQKYNLPGQVTINDIINLPDIFTLEDKGIDENSKNIIFNLLNDLLTDLLNERSKEGQILKQDIQNRIDAIQNNIETISKNSHQILEEFKEKISRKVQTINETFQDAHLAESQRQHLYLSLDKMDIHEELVRFKNHINNLVILLNSANPEKGKQLDFTLQELSREINTIAAKTANSQIVDLVIAIKVEIEKIREQVQNIL